MAKRDKGIETPPAPPTSAPARVVDVPGGAGPPNHAAIFGVVKGTMAEGTRSEEGAAPAWALHQLEDGRYRLDRGASRFSGDAEHLALVVLAANHEGVCDFTRDEQEELASVLGFDLPALPADVGDDIEADPGSGEAPAREG